MKVKTGTAWIRVIKNGAVSYYSSSQYAEEFGHTPIKPREGESLFGGRYTHTKFADAATTEGTPGTSHANTGSFDVNQEEHTL